MRGRRELVIISDFQRSNWAAVDFAVLPEDTLIQLESVAPPEPLANLAVLRVGTIGRVQFYGKDDTFTHGIKYGKGLITGLMLQWQNGEQVAVWPPEVAKAKLKFPAFIKVTSN